MHSRWRAHRSDGSNSVLETGRYQAYGNFTSPAFTGGAVPGSIETPNRYRFTGKEDLSVEFSVPYTDFGARHYSPALRRWTTLDPMSEKYYTTSPYVYCNDNPVNLVDPDGRDWYINNETGNYTWFSGKEDHEGYTYYGERGSVLGEMEDIINSFVVNTLRLGGLYTERFTFEIASKDKGVFSNNIETGLFEDFVNNTGPEFTVFLQDHPMTKVLKESSTSKKRDTALQKYNFDSLKGIENWKPWDVFTHFSLTRQFVGSYSYLGKISSGGNYVYNMVFDSKSRRSFFLHIPNNASREESTKFGNTYQFYLWVSLRK